MSAFVDRLLLEFLRDEFVMDLFTTQLALPELFGLIFSPENIEVEELSLAGIGRREFALPAFETLRTIGTDEQLTPVSERTRIERTEPRRGRLTWVDVFLDLDLVAKVSATAGPIESVTSQNLLDKVGTVHTLAQLRTKLLALYPESIVDVYFSRFRITSVAEFRKKPHVFLEVVSAPTPAYDPNDPAVRRRYRARVCVQIQPDVRLSESLQSAKLCRSVMAVDGDFVETTAEYDVNLPYAFVVLFPNAAVTDDTLPPLTAAQVVAKTKNLFQAEGMLAHFL